MTEIFGFNPVWEALQSHSTVRKVVMTEEEKERLKRIRDLAEKRRIPVETISREEFRKAFGGKKQWVMALVEEPFAKLEDFVSRLSPDPASLVLVLDQIQDPQNLGSILRTAEACGVQGVAISLHRTAPFSPAVYRSSAGAALHLNLYQVPSLGSFFRLLKERGFWIAGTDSHRGEDIFKAKVNFPLAVVLGSEGWGVRPLILKRCDFLLKLPMFGKVNSLNVSVACGAVLYELRRRQRELGLI